MLRISQSILATLTGAILCAVSVVALSNDPNPVLILNGSSYVLAAGSTEELSRSIDAAVSIRSTQLLDHEVHLDFGVASYGLPAAELGYDVDRASAQHHILAKFTRERAATGTMQRLVARALDRALVVAADLELTHDSDAARERLLALASLIDEPAVDAQMLIAEHKIIPSRPGRRLSVDASLVRLAHDLEASHRVVELCVDEIAPEVTEQELAPVDVTSVLSSYETSFKGKAGPRAVNIRAAGRFLDGAVLLPGEILSFNEYVGRRIHGRGFVDAPVIINDELEQDVGGGVCQVASTLHAAAVFGNVQVVNRRSHSRPSGYAPLGLDATVIDGEVDLKLRNPYDEPLLVHVSFPSEFKIRVELLGRAPSARVSHEYFVTHREPFARRIWHRSEIAAGAFKQKQKGIEGMDVTSVVTIKHLDGKSERRRYHSKYYPVPEVFWLGDGVDQAALPQVSEGVTRVIINGEDATQPLSGATATETGEETPALRRRENEVL